MEGQNPGRAEIERQIEDTEPKIKSAESAIAERPDSNRSRSLQITLRNLRGELSNLKAMLERAEDEAPSDSPEDSKTKAELDRNKDELDDIEAKLSLAADPVEINNLTVSKRFLQMERNQLLIRLTHETAPAVTDEDIETVRKEVEAKIRIIQAQNAQIEDLKKQLSAAKAQVWDPLRESSSDSTRITVTAGRLRAINGEARRLGAENYELKKQMGELKNKKDGLHRAIGDLTVHVKDAEAHARETEARAMALADELQEAERRIEALERENKGLRDTIIDSRRHGL